MCMKNQIFTPEELAELAIFDAEVDASPITIREAAECNERDREVKLARNGQKRAAYAKQYREAHKAKYAEYKRQYEEANKAKISKKKHEYYLATKELFAERSRRYYQANKEKIKEYNRRRYAAIKARRQESE